MEEQGQPRVHILVKLWVLFHLFAITFYALPNPPEGLRAWSQADVDAKTLQFAQRPIGTDWLLIWNKKYLKDAPPLAHIGGKEIRFVDYLISTGFWQYWDMFSPNPSNWDGFVEVEVVYRDRSIKPFAYPRMKLLSIPTKYVKERYRKFLERAHSEENQWLWPVFAQRIALEAYKDPRNPPTLVRLHRRWKLVKPPDKPPSREYTDYVYYQHVVDQDLLRKQAR